MVERSLTREKALYEGHAIAAVAATSEAVAAQALKLIRVDYEVLPHVLDVAKAMQPDAPLLHDDMYTIGVEPKPAKPSNVAKRVDFVLGDVAAGFAKADIVIEREFDTQPVQQAKLIRLGLEATAQWVDDVSGLAELLKEDGKRGGKAREGASEELRELISGRG